MTIHGTGGIAPLLDRGYPGEPGSLRSSRRDTVACLAAAGVGDDVCDRAALAVSELASNAIQATPGEDYTVVVELDHRDVVITVANRAAGGLPITGAMPAPEALRGRGLAIVAALGAELGVRQRDGVVSVAARLPAGIASEDVRLAAGPSALGR